MLDSFKKFGLGVSYQTVYRHIYARIRTQFKAQTPQLEGEGDRIIFGSASLQSTNVFTVMSVVEDARQLTLNAGRMHRIGVGARLEVFRAGDTAGSRARTAVVEIIEPGVASSTARILEQHGAEPIRQGDEAVLLAHGADAPPRGVRLLQPEVAASGAASLGEVARLLRSYGGEYVQPSQPGQVTDFQVSVNERGEYLILDASLRPYPNIGCVLSVADDAAPMRLVERLVHLSKYLNVRELDNKDSQSVLAHYFLVDLVGSPNARSGNGSTNAAAGLPVSHSPRVGDWVYLRARNNGTATLKITVLDLRPNWSITQIFPSRAGRFELLEAGRELLIPLRADLPQGYDEGTDVLKIFATTETADLKCFELPALDLQSELPSPQLRTPFAGRREPTRGGHEASTRDMGTPFISDEDWVALHLSVSVRRS